MLNNTMVKVINFNADVKCNDLYLGASKTLYGDTSLTIDAPIINIGKAGQTCNFIGDLASVKVTNLEVNDQLITINKNGSDNTSKSAGFNIAATGGDTEGYFKTNADGNGFVFKAPLNQYVLSVPALTQNATVMKSDDDYLSSVSNLNIAKISAFNSIANSKYLYKDSNGDLVGSDVAVSNFVNADIAAGAAIDRSKIAADTSNLGRILINNPTDGTISSTNALSLTSDGKLYISPSDGVYMYGPIKYQHWGFLDNICHAYGVVDINPQPIYGEYAAINFMYLLEFRICCQCAADWTTAIICGKIKINQGAGNSKPTFSDIVDYVKIADSGLESIDASMAQTLSNREWNLCVSGVSSKVLNFKGRVNLTAIGAL